MDAALTVGRFGVEAEWGTIPGVAFQAFRITGVTVNPEYENVRSGEILGTLQRADQIRIGEGAQLQVEAELSFETLDTMFELMALNSFQADTPVTGTDRLVDGLISKSVTFEIQFGGQDVFLWMTGGMLSSMNLSIQRGQLVTATLGFMGKEIDGGAATQGTGAHLARLTTRPFNAVGELTTQEEGGAGINRIDQFDLSFERELEARHETGASFPFEIGLNPLALSGSFRRYFQDLTLFQKAKAFTDSSFKVGWTDKDGNQLDFNFPRIQFGNPTFENPNTGTAYASYPWEAALDPVTGAQVQIDRTAA